jgi:hypothetical protein
MSAEQIMSTEKSERTFASANECWKNNNNQLNRKKSAPLRICEQVLAKIMIISAPSHLQTSAEQKMSTEKVSAPSHLRTSADQNNQRTLASTNKC